MRERNQPSKAGELLGAEVARLTPETAAMCGTCAFRKGTYPNRCAQTLLSAIGCVIECAPFNAFHCHERNDDDGHESVCEGYLSAIRQGLNWGSDLKLP